MVPPASQVTIKGCAFAVVILSRPPDFYRRSLDAALLAQK
jgi:hypothetical protein